MITIGYISSINAGKYNVIIPAFTGIADSKDDANWKEFSILATVCGLANAIDLYAVDDYVYIGFLHNNMGLPVILGHAINLTDSKNTALLCKAIPSLTLSGLKFASIGEGIAPKVELPVNTILLLPPNKDESGKELPCEITMELLKTISTIVNRLRTFSYNDSNGQLQGYNEESKTGDGLTALLKLLLTLGLLPLLTATVDLMQGSDVVSL